MLLGHGAIGQFSVAEALSGLVVNAGTVDVSMGQSASFSIGSEVATGSAVFAVTTAGAPKKGESDKQKARRKNFKARHAKNIAKVKMSAAYWADKVKW